MLTLGQLDDGGGMDPDAMRCCMSFGFSDKKSQFAIGRCTDCDLFFCYHIGIPFHIYFLIFQFGVLDGNGFKTSSMRLGADVIVFSCHLNNRYGSTNEHNITLKLVSATGLLLYWQSPYYLKESVIIVD